MAWLLPRAVGLPFPLDGSQPEPVDLLGGLTTQAEVLGLLPRAAAANRRCSAATRAPVAIYVGLTLAAIVLMLLVSGAGRHH